MNVVMLKCRHGSVTEPCDQLAKAVILHDDGDGGVSANPVCEEHAFIEAHELGGTSNDEDYLIVPLPAFGVGALA